MLDVLKSKLIEPLESVKGRKLTDVRYLDIGISGAKHSDSGTGIHVVAHGVNLVFENDLSLYLHWDGVKGWVEYVLVCGNVDPIDDDQGYSMSDDANWKGLIQQPVFDFKIFGYKKHEIRTTDLQGTELEIRTYENEPHLVSLSFPHGKTVAFANFYFEENYVPKLPVGDDVWAIFDEDVTVAAIRDHNFDKLDAE